MANSNYQQLQRYKGSLYGDLQYSGIEYDYEIPDNMVTSSPGGVSTTQHHYTKGIYGVGASQWDIYGGDNYRYPSAEFGNLYQVGQSSSDYLHMYPKPADQMFTENQSNYAYDRFTPSQDHRSQDLSVKFEANAIDQASKSRISSINTFTSSKNPKKSPMQENFKQVELIPPPEDNMTPVGSGMVAPPGTPKVLTDKDVTDLKDTILEAETKVKKVVTVPNPLLMFVMVLLFYLAMDFWLLSTEGIMTKYIHGGKMPGWKWLLFYALLFSGALALVSAIFGFPLLYVEEAESKHK